MNTQQIFTPLPSALWGAVAGFLILWSVFWLFKLLTGKEGMGRGDFVLLAALGAWLGWPMLPQIILFAALAGLLFHGTLLLLRRHQRSQPLPFGPYLAAGGALSLFLGNVITPVL